MKQYTEDFDRERVAREEAVKVKNIVEENLQKKEREITSLREQLNMHARQQVRGSSNGSCDHLNVEIKAFFIL